MKTSAKLGVSRRKAYLRGRLLEKRRMLLDHMMSGFSAAMESSGKVPADSVDVANDTLSRETTCEIGTIESSAVTQIDDALQRLEEGTYGLCDECGKKIPEERLKVLPFAAECVECKTRHEREALAGGPAAQMTWQDLEKIGSSDEGAEEDQAIARGGHIRGRRPA